MKLLFQSPLFAAAVKAALEKRGWSYAHACRAAPFINAAMLSRAVNQRAVSRDTFIALCAALDLDPFGFLHGRAVEKDVCIQPLTVGVSRETLAVVKKYRRACGNG